MYIPKYFKIQELVPPDVFADRGEAAWALLDDRLLITLDALHDQFGTLVLNTWAYPALQKQYGIRKESVLRVAGTATGAQYSQHKYGRAADCLSPTYTAEQMRKYVLANPQQFPFITAIEADVNWFHFDCRNCKAITVFHP